MRACAAALLLLAGCGTDPGGEAKVTTNQIARLATPEQEPTADPLATVRLQALTPGDVTHAGLGGPGCRFSIGGTVLLAANADDAMARIGGATLHLTHAAPVGPSGGFFEAGQLGISVGRTAAEDGPARATIGWPGRITVTDRRNGAQLAQQGMWRCGA